MTRPVMLAIAAAVLLLILLGGLRYCENQRNRGSQGRVDTAQADAASNSAADAIGTVARSGEAQRQSEELTRSNERDIRNAPGANERVNPGVDVAGRRALCLRDTYRNRPECRVFNAAPR